MASERRNEIVKLSKRMGKLRFGQFLSNAIDSSAEDGFGLSEEDIAKKLFAMTDDQLYEVCKAYVVLNNYKMTQEPK